MDELQWQVEKVNGLQAQMLVRTYKKMRAKSSALLSTSTTVIADDPSLNVRWDEFPENLKTEYKKKEDLRQPVRVILDSQHRIQPTHKLFFNPFSRLVSL